MFNLYLKHMFNYQVCYVKLLGKRGVKTLGQFMILWMYKVFYKRPEKYIGDLETWYKAEAALTEALNEFGKHWQINEGDVAFYGPKIDISVSDAMKRKFQCATLQLDFQLPSRFDLTYSKQRRDVEERRGM